MTFDELVAHLRGSVLRDTATPALWTDIELGRYLNEAQDQFARRTHCLADEESAFTSLVTVAGTALYTLDDQIVFVADVAHSDGTPLRAAVRARMSRSIGQSRPRHYSTDAAVRQIRLYPTPDAIYTLSLLVARKPAKLVDGTDVPEIDEDYHLALCEWAAYRALRNNDVDGTNTVEAGKFREGWEMAVREGKRNTMRYRSVPLQLNNWTGK